MAVYRIVSGYVLYTLTKSWIRVCTQLVDLELFRVLYVSHKYKFSKKSSPQRLISMIEAVFEAAPQTLLQLIFLRKQVGSTTQSSSYQSLCRCLISHHQQLVMTRRLLG
eukprot:48256_1